VNKKSRNKDKKVGGWRVYPKESCLSSSVWRRYLLQNKSKARQADKTNKSEGKKQI
jgi:hypothetical protein